DDGAVPRCPRRPIISPAERGLDDDALRHHARAVAGTGGRIRTGISRDVTEEIVAPADRTAERAGIGVDQELRGIEPVSVRRRPRSVHPVAVELPGADVG